MLFSEYFGVTKTDEDDWFDPILTLDTRLFIDPFLIYTYEYSFFEGSHQEIINFFNSAFTQIAKSRGKINSVYYRSAVRALHLPEVQELCLGYAQGGTKGSGSGLQFAEIMAAALWEAVETGMTDINHFEEIALLHEGIGADRISDAVANILRPRIINYTIQICKEHNIHMEEAGFRQGNYDTKLKSWRPLVCSLPRNPFNNRPILLVPKRYLRFLPTINAEDFWDYCFSNENEVIRNEFGEDISRNVNKETIVSFATRHQEIRKEYIETVEKSESSPYNFDDDEHGLYNWYPRTKGYIEANPIDVNIDSETSFINCIDIMLKAYKHFVEENGGWYLLWNDEIRKPKHETASQLLCLGVIKNYCQANNIDITREAEVGRGPVDFKASRGYNLRVLIEVKKANNTKFWDGLNKQLPTYMYSEGIRTGYFMVIVLYEKDREKLAGINKIARNLSRKFSYKINVLIVDATEKLSASQL